MLNSKDIFIRENESAKDALKKLNKSAEKVLLVVDKDKRLLGTITDGDIRRYILSGKTLENSIVEFFNRDPVYINSNEFTIEKAREMVIKNKIELIPLLDDGMKIVGFKTWDLLFSKVESKETAFKINGLDIPIVIMAGGKGARLEPFSKIFPKPLIPVGDKPMIEIIIDEFKKYGVRKFYFTLNYKGEMIKSYFDSVDKNYDIEYVWEKDFLGTASSLKLLEKTISDIFIVSNCDIIVNAKYAEVLEFHKREKSMLTILSSVQHHKIPYGVVKSKEKGVVTELIEKPEYTIMINTGVYVLCKEALQFIPEDEHFDMTDMIKVLIDRNKKVVTYPVNENDYTDIGQWEEYKKALEKIELLRK